MLACNADGIALIKSFEGCILKSYLDQGGVWTIGWGHTGDDVSEGLVWTQDQADAAFLSDLHDKAEDPVNQLVKITIKPTITNDTIKNKSATHNPASISQSLYIRFSLNQRGLNKTSANLVIIYL